MARFPAEALRASGGMLYSSIGTPHPSSDMERLSLVVVIKFEPLQFGNELLDPQLTCAWTLSNCRDWRQLEGIHAAGEFEELESSFYTFEHDDVAYTEVTIGKRQGRHFQVSCRADMDLVCLTEDAEENKGLRVVAEIVLSYSHLNLSLRRLKPFEQNLNQAVEIAARHVDLALYKPPIITRGGFWFEPLV